MEANAREISIEIPSWLVSHIETLSAKFHATIDIVSNSYANIVDFLNHQNNFWWFLSSLVIFWPIWVYFAITVTAASTWIFWLLASVLMGILQVIYVTYQFFMIAADVTVLTVLKTYQVLMRSRMINTIFFFSKRLRNSRQRTSQRRRWRKECEAAKSYNDFLKIHMSEPAALVKEKGDNAMADKLDDESSASSSSVSSASTASSSFAMSSSGMMSLSSSALLSSHDGNDSSIKDASIAGGLSSDLQQFTGTRIRRQQSFGALRTLHEDQESDPDEPLGPDSLSPPRPLKRSASYNSSSMMKLSLYSQRQQQEREDDTKQQVRAELGNMAADLLPSTTARMREARHAYLNESIDDKSMEHLLSGVVKRNHLTLEDLLVENARSVAESGQYRYSAASRKVISAHYLEVSKGLDALAEGPTNTPDPLVELSGRMTLLRKMKQNMGRTALMLSGGGAQAMYHLGTIRALIDAGLYDEIKVISGTSGGSITAAMCAIKSSQDLYENVCVNTVSTDFLKTGRMQRENIRWFPTVQDMIAYWFKHRLLVDSAEFRRTCEFYYSDTTFEEAFERTGKHVCITVSASRATGGTVQRLLLNHISTPHVTLASAVAASCALPGVMAPAKLQTKDANGNLEPFEVDGVEWIDGSVQADLPFQRISTMFNVSNYVVAQTNFHVLPFLRKEHHPSTRSLYWRIFQTMEWDIRNRALKLSRLGLFPRLFGQDVSKVFKQKYHGNLTLVPRFTAMQTFGMKALVNPTVKDMDGYLKYGQIAAWPYLSVLRDMMRLETSLDFALNRLKERRAELYPDLGDLDNMDDLDDLETIASGGTHSIGRRSVTTSPVPPPRTVVRFSGGGMIPMRAGGDSASGGGGSSSRITLHAKVAQLESENNILKQRLKKMEKLLSMQRPQDVGKVGSLSFITARASSGSNAGEDDDDAVVGEEKDVAAGEDYDEDDSGRHQQQSDGQPATPFAGRFDEKLMKHTADEREALKVVKRLSLLTDD